MKEAWNHKRSSQRNLRDMGLANDPNKVIRIPSFKQEQIKKAKEMINHSDSEEENVVKSRVPPKIAVAQQLEAVAKAPRERRFM